MPKCCPAATIRLTPFCSGWRISAVFAPASSKGAVKNVCKNRPRLRVWGRSGASHRLVPPDSGGGGGEFRPSNRRARSWLCVLLGAFVFLVRDPLYTWNAASDGYCLCRARHALQRQKSSTEKFPDLPQATPPGVNHRLPSRMSASDFGSTSGAFDSQIPPAGTLRARRAARHSRGLARRSRRRGLDHWS